VNKQFKEFNAAMDTILKADPAKVKAEMAAEKQARSKARSIKGGVFVRERGHNPLVEAVNAVEDRERRRKIN
jgi:hypothetical protein